jgi:thiol-disulfide isomerase/thioredoxin
MLRKILGYFLFTLACMPLLSHAEQSTLKPFVSGSYQQMLDNHANQSFMLVVWSITCSSCLKDMALLNKMHKKRPGMKIVMLTTDDASATEQIQQILVKNELAGLENWLFADENAQKLRYEIDPKWYGELPRTFFLNKKHEREGISGVLTQDDYEAYYKKYFN